MCPNPKDPSKKKEYYLRPEQREPAKEYKARKWVEYCQKKGKDPNDKPWLKKN